MSHRLMDGNAMPRAHFNTPDFQTHLLFSVFLQKTIRVTQLLQDKICLAPKITPTKRPRFQVTVSPVLARAGIISQLMHTNEETDLKQHPKQIMWTF